MSDCRVPKLFAYLFTAYMLASVYYVGHTACMGTPFKDSLSSQQMEIYKKAAEDRARVFTYGLIGSAILLLVFKPF